MLKPSGDKTLKPVSLELSRKLTLHSKKSGRATRSQQEREERFQQLLIRQQSEADVALAEKNDTRQNQMKHELEELVRQNKWMDERHLEWLGLVNKTSASLVLLMPSIKKLLDLGPALENLAMTKETAIVLGQFETYQENATHPRLPRRISESAQALVNSLALLFLPLSPLKEVRASDDRKQMLSELLAALLVAEHEFHALCRRFERVPRSEVITHQLAGNLLFISTHRVMLTCRSMSIVRAIISKTVIPSKVVILPYAMYLKFGQIRNFTYSKNPPLLLIPKVHYCREL